MFNNRPLGNGPLGNPKKPTVRRETVLVPVKKPTNTNGVRKPTHTSAAPAANRFKLSERSGSSHSTVKSKKLPPPVQRAVAASRGIKRKSTTPDRVQFSSDEDDDSDQNGSDWDVSRKRLKTGGGVAERGVASRDVVCEAAFADRQPLDITHGADCTSLEDASKFKNPWNHEGFETLELQYPSNSDRERFELKWPRNEKEDYKPMEDISETIRKIAEYYFPEPLREKFTSDDVGFGRRFTRAWIRQSIPDFKSIVEEFNSVLTPLVQDGTIKQQLAAKRQIPFPLVQRILDQVYSRTVSPKVESLRAYENGTDYVYGELLNRFCSSIFHQVQMNENQVFVDLGSGVGNVVLQAALEVGCESWGIEYMKNPCDLAELQAKEFPARAQLWGIKVGKVHLRRGDFTQNIEIGEVLKRADVVLVNNQAFTPALNDKLRDMFLDLKTGCKIVSLKPFVPEGHKISMRTIGSVANLFVQQKFEYFSRSVSWTDHSGNYYIATKDPRPLEKFLKEHGSR